jgi:hypothetical protein
MIEAAHLPQLCGCGSHLIDTGFTAYTTAGELEGICTKAIQHDATHVSVPNSATVGEQEHAAATAHKMSSCHNLQ